MVQRVAKKEGYALEKSSADSIALLGDGSFRDTLGILQKVLSSSVDKEITAEEVERITGAPKLGLIHQYVRGIVEKDSEKGIEAVKKAVDGNIDMKVFFKLILQRMRYVLLLRYAPKMEHALKLQVSEDEFEFLIEIARNKEYEFNSETLVTLLRAYDEIKIAFIPSLPLELALIDICE
tara:strand:- start:546 stop:1082 length:537 start_codon:yes stop_codon:yes gene_type:complete